jgi:hypothetical protein
MSDCVLSKATKIPYFCGRKLIENLVIFYPARQIVIPYTNATPFVAR